MLKIGICTEQADFASYVENLMGSMLEGRDKWVIEAFTPAVIAEKRGRRLLDYHIFCIDEQLFRTQELDIVSYLRRIRPEASILLLEGRRENGIEGIRYHLFAYRINRLLQQDLEAEFDRLWQYANVTSHCLSVRQDGEMISIPIQNIIYIESANHRVTLHTTMGDYECYEKLYELETLLKEDDFFRCHKSYLVSRRFVTDCSNMEISLGELSLPVGRSYKDAILEMLNVGELVSNSSEKTGSLIGITEQGKNIELHIRPEQKILIGRAEGMADVVILQPGVSRIHCMLIYHDKENLYEIVDLSKNGTYVADAGSELYRLVPDISYKVKSGTRISFGDTEHIYYLG